MRWLQVAGLVVAMLLAGPAAMAVEDTDEATRPVEVSGGLTCSAYWQAGDSDDVVLGPLGEGNLVRRETRGFLGRYNVDAMSDERLMGTYTARMNVDEYVGPEPFTGDHLGIWTSELRIENADGAWQGQETSFYLPGTWEPPAEGRWDPLVLRGEGGYAGLTALVELRLRDLDCYCWSGVGEAWCSADVRGVILEGEPPPAPSDEA